MKLSPLVWLACLSGLSAAPAHANAVPPMALDRQHAQADLVVVARLGEHRTCEVGGRRLACAEILTEVVLKGFGAIPGARRYLILSSSIMERSMEDLFLFGSALMFLRGIGATTPNPVVAQPEYYEPVQSRRSILPVDGRYGA
ncbi:MAG TPA: hypothetical protein VMS43_15225 [Allosphingosinicella sp.]|nr:hypothetical protein [Allosphingosinicella sp.]